MKNWADIEETLFQKISLKKDTRMTTDWGWKYSKDPYSWRLLVKVIRTYLGQDFDKVFSLICHKFPKQNWGKKSFLLHFEGRNPDLAIDENNKIVLTKYGRKWSRFEDKPKKESYIFTSHDYEEKKEVFIRYYSNFKWVDIEEYDRKGWTYRNWTVEKKKTTVVAGSRKEFTSKNDREFKRLKAEKRKLLRKKYKKPYNPQRVESLFREILQKWKENCELNQSKQAEKLREAKRKNLEIIERLGFDPILSFRGHQRKIKTKNYE
jgi:hypothetical protein